GVRRLAERPAARQAIAEALRSLRGRGTYQLPHLTRPHPPDPALHHAVPDPPWRMAHARSFAPRLTACRRRGARPTLGRGRKGGLKCLSLTASASAPSRALAKAWFGADINRPTGMKAVDALGNVLMAAAAASIESVPEATSHAAFDVASRLHRELNTVATEMAISYDDSIAHELKNPLGAAKGAAELLQSGEGVEEEAVRAQFTELVLRNVNRTLALLDSVRGKAPDAGG
ncbi:MAG: histidine kinase dimerization/phospho-acceptor domain-containing protein, partial [Gemmatimonadota bacterium]